MRLIFRIHISSPVILLCTVVENHALSLILLAKQNVHFQEVTYSEREFLGTNNSKDTFWGENSDKTFFVRIFKHCVNCSALHNSLAHS